MWLTGSVAGPTFSFMHNPSVRALYRPVASRLLSRTGLPLPRLLLPIAISIVMGGTLTMVGNSPLILLNDLLVSANANLPSGVATLEPLKMFAPLPIGLALLAACLLYFHFFGGKLLRGEVDKGVTPARTQRSEEHTSELQSLMRISYAVFCLKKKKNQYKIIII